MKKIVFTILTLIIIMVGMTNSLASGDITPFAVRDPNDVKPLPYEGSGKTSGTMSPALRAPSDGKITIYFRLCLHELSGIMALSQRRGCHHGEITASA